MENRYKVNFDIKQRAVTDIKFKQGDSDSSVLEVTLYDNGVPVDVTGEEIEFRFLKPDETVVFQDTTSGVSVVDAPKGIIQCVLKSNTLGAAGVVRTEIHRAKEGAKLTTPNFYFTVEDSIDGDGILSSNYISAIENKILEWQKAFDKSETARATTFSENEASRKADFEQIKRDYDSYKNVMIAESNVAELQSQINENKSQLAENATKVTTETANVISMSDSVDGLANIEIGGRTLKNELSYNPDTWAEWTKSAGVVGDSGGLEFTADGISEKNSNISTKLKVNTKYGILINVLKNSLTLSDLMIYTRLTGCTNVVVSKGVIGNIKTIITTQNVITDNTLVPYISKNEPAGNKIKIKDIRIYELPAGSEIENDFNTLTADQLAIKYPWHSGISSVGEAEGNKIEALSTGKNLISCKEDWSIENKGITLSYDVAKDIYTLNGVRNENSTELYLWINNNLKFITKQNDKIGLSIKYISGNVIGSCSFMTISRNMGWHVVNLAVKDYDISTYYIDSYGNRIHDALAIYCGRSEVSFNNYKFKLQLTINSDSYDVYESYREDKTSNLLSAPLRGLSNDVRDIASGDTVERKVGKVVLDGSENNLTVITQNENFIVIKKPAISNLKPTGGMPPYPQTAISNKFNWINRPWALDDSISANMEGFSIANSTSDIHFKVLKSKLTTPDLAGFKAWLQANPTTVYYELATPTIEKLPQPLTLQSFKSGTLQVNTAIPPYLTARYPSNLSGRISTIEETSKSTRNVLINQNAINLGFDLRITALENK